MKSQVISIKDQGHVAIVKCDCADTIRNTVCSKGKRCFCEGGKMWSPPPPVTTSHKTHITLSGTKYYTEKSKSGATMTWTFANPMDCWLGFTDCPGSARLPDWLSGTAASSGFQSHEQLSELVNAATVHWGLFVLWNCAVFCVFWGEFWPCLRLSRSGWLLHTFPLRLRALSLSVNAAKRSKSQTFIGFS